MQAKSWQVFWFDQNFCSMIFGQVMAKSVVGEDVLWYCTFDLNSLSGPWISFFCFTPNKTIVGQIKIIRSPTWGNSLVIIIG
jgi:hypothetical protein